VKLRHQKNGYTLLHRGKALTKTHASDRGEFQAEFMAGALGVELSGMGGSVSAKVASGLLDRVMAISSLDLHKPEGRLVLEQLMRTAAIQRDAFNTVGIG
jgi:hypothetical protein